MWWVIGSSTQEPDPTDDWLTRIPNPLADPSLHRHKKISSKYQFKKRGQMGIRKELHIKQKKGPLNQNKN